MRPLALAAAFAAPSRRRARFVAEVAGPEVLERASPGAAATPFQDPRWLSAWYAAQAGEAGLEPLVVTVRDADGQLALRLPLVRRREGRRRVVEFADLNLTDYNAPLLGPAAPVDPAGARAAWRALVRALAPVDVLRLRKMPPRLGDRPNPLVLLGGASPCALNGNLIALGDDYEAWRFSLGRHARMDLERSWRVFQRHPQAVFRRVADVAEAQRVLAVMEAQQAERMRALGRSYGLGSPTARAFYRRLIAEGLPSGFVELTVLAAGHEIVAGCLAIRDARSVVIVRLTNAGGAWSNCSPGRLAVERTIQLLHAEGCRSVDFSVGNQDYKRRFGPEQTPLVDLVRAVGWRGLADAGRAAVAGWLRARPALETRVRRLAAGRKPEPTEEPASR